MTRLGRAALMFFLGITMARLLWSGSFGFFIQQRMALPLLCAAVALVIMGIYEGRQALRQEAEDPDAVRRSVAPGVGWLMVLPLVVLVSVAPAGLGAAAASRVDAFTPVEVQSNFPPLDTSTQPVEMRVIDFVDRAIWDTEGSIDDITVRLEGLVVNSPEVDDGFLLTRFLVSCCAADGLPLKVALRESPQQFDDDQWVRATVQLLPPVDPEISQANLDLAVQARIVAIEALPEAPDSPYESPF